MIVNTYKKYILNLFVKTLIEIIFIFFTLILIINLFEEINFLKKENVSAFYPIFLSLLNAPSVIFDILPFIFLVSTIFFFIKLMDKNELFIFKYKIGLFIFGIIIIITSEISIRYSSSIIIENIYTASLPLLLFFFVYIYFNFKLKKPLMLD